MPLVFSPLSEAVLDQPPKKLLPKHAFIMRQLGTPPEIDIAINAAVIDGLQQRGYVGTDASTTTGGKDYLERILGLIRATGFTVAIFSEQTRITAMANIALELGFAAMCGKPLIIVKSKEGTAPSDLKRTDWIEYDPENVPAFNISFSRALDELATFHQFEKHLLQVALEARSTDCAIALERCNKGFLLTGDDEFIAGAEAVLEKVNGIGDDLAIGDLERLRSEIKTFIRQARSAHGGANFEAVAAAAGG
jgi:hypothetical protein